VTSQLHHIVNNIHAAYSKFFWMLFGTSGEGSGGILLACRFFTQKCRNGLNRDAVSNLTVLTQNSDNIRQSKQFHVHGQGMHGETLLDKGSTFKDW
jgi:hypothetical protein